MASLKNTTTPVAAHPRRPARQNRIQHLILASTSPFRRQLLTAAGITVQAVAPEVDESGIAGATPAAQAQLRAEAKAMAVARKYPDAVVIGADQVLSHHGHAFDKVDSAQAAHQRLRMLSGSTHYLHSAVALAVSGQGEAEPKARVVRSFVLDLAMPMRDLSDEDIAAYIAHGEWRGSVGCYQFEHRGVHLFAGADHDASAIVGLPLQPLLAALRELGVDLLRHPQPPWILADGCDEGD